MAITINGTGTITGVLVGGLPDGIVDTDMLAGNAATAAKIADDAVTFDKLNTTDTYSYTEFPSLTADSITTSFAAPDAANYKWDLPAAGTYKISGNFRIRVASAYVNARAYNSTAGAYEGEIRLMDENPTTGTYNSLCTPTWFVTVTQASTIVLHLKANTTANSPVLQSDANGRNAVFWERVA